MNGAIPPSNSQGNKLVPIGHTLPAENNPNCSDFSVTGVNQLNDQVLLTNAIERYEFDLPTSLDTAQESVLSALQLKHISDPLNQFICSEFCVSLLTDGAWSLNPQCYTNTQVVDIAIALSEAREVSFDLHGQDSALQGVLISYDGYSESRLRHFINNKLDKNNRYILQMNTASQNNAHFLVCYFEQKQGWMTHDSVFGLRQISDLDGNLTSSGHVFLAENADWGPEVNEKSLVFIEATPRRIAILAEYLLRFRYYGEDVARMAMNGFDPVLGAFPPRPYYQANLDQPMLLIFPMDLPVPTDLESRRYANHVASIIPSNNVVPYKNRSVERALMALEPLMFHVKHQNVLNTQAIDLVSVLIEAGELDTNGVFPPRAETPLKRNAFDAYVSNIYLVSDFFEKIDKTKQYFLRVGVNNSDGYYLALRYLYGNNIFPSWYYYGKADETQIDSQAQENWFIFADPAGNLSQAGLLICYSQNCAWGEEADQFSLQVIEATFERQKLLQKYVSSLRHRSNDAVFAVKDQYSLQQAVKFMLPEKVVKHSSSLSQNNLDELYGELLDLIEKDKVSAPPTSIPIFQPCMSSGISELPASMPVFELSANARKKQEHIELLNVAMENPNESIRSKVAFFAIKLMLEKHTDSEIISQCRAYWSEQGKKGALYLTFDRLEQMKDYYLQGGLLLLRGYPLTTTRFEAFPVKSTKAFLDFMQENVDYGCVNLLKKFTQRVKLGKIEGVTLQELSLPTKDALDRFIKRCGFTRKLDEVNFQTWIFNNKFTHAISTDNLHILSAIERIYNKYGVHIEEEQIRSGESIYYRKTKCETKKLRHMVASAGSIQFSDTLLGLQKEELQKAVDSEMEKAVNKLKFKVVLSALNGLGTEQIRQECNTMADKFKIPKIIITDKVVALMREYYSRGGITLLRGYQPLSKGNFSARIMNHILDLIEKNPKLLVEQIHTELFLFALDSGLSQKRIPNEYTINRFLMCCGCNWNAVDQKWE